MYLYFFGGQYISQTLLRGSARLSGDCLHIALYPAFKLFNLSLNTQIAQTYKKGFVFMMLILELVDMANWHSSVQTDRS